jgi:hypothetical protein
MAKLRSATATIEILPCKKETPTSNWIDTRVVLEYHIQDQKLNIELPKRNVSIRHEGFEKLIKNSRKYIESLPISPSTIDYISNSYHFFPMEPSFNLRIFAGSFSDEKKCNGTLVVEFSMSLKALEVDELLHDSIGCSVRMQIPDFLLFLDDLEQEVKAVIIQ